MSSLLVAAKADGSGLAVVPGGPQAYLRQEFGILLEQNQNESIARAISKPEAFLATRVEKQNEAVKTAGMAFEKYLVDLLNVGVPTDTAKYMATQHAKEIYDAEIRIYEMANPGYGKAVGKQVLDRQEKEATRDLYLEDKKAYKKKVLSKYKAKKAAKNATKS